MRCEGMIPERVTTEFDEDGAEVRRVEPGHRCDEEATALARSVRAETQPGVHGAVWRIEAERAYCPACFTPGAVTHLDGTVTQHAAMAVDERQGA